MTIVTHTNDPFWKLNVAQACAPSAPGAFQTPFRGGMATVTNVGDLTFMLFPEYAPNTVSIFQGLSDSGFYNTNTIFHRVINGFIIQGGDPLTNGLGGLVFQYNDEFNPQAIFSGNGQLALANSGKNTDGSQFFVTEAPYRFGDFQYTIFGQLVRGFTVLTNIEITPVDNSTDNRPLANEIITQASMVPDTADTVITLVATIRVGGGKQSHGDRGRRGRWTGDKYLRCNFGGGDQYQQSAVLFQQHGHKHRGSGK
ncbi:MAG TPA: peptidylprolyl isomerase [Verrucomicrobiae bacterium]